MIQHSESRCIETVTHLHTLRKKSISDRVYEKILMCVLEKYDEESFTSSDTLSHCFEKDRLTGGALCLEVFNMKYLICHYILHLIDG
jgi:hypothetical protein